MEWLEIQMGLVVAPGVIFTRIIRIKLFEEVTCTRP